MRILLDECLPRELADEFMGHDVRTVQQQGWSGLENGELLSHAAGAFNAFLTVDKRIERTIRARSNRIQSLRPLVPEIRKVLEEIQPGTFVRVGA